MDQKVSITNTIPHVLIEGPRWGDAEFYGKWLSAAAEAEAFWKEAFKDPGFKKQVERVCVVYIPDFGMTASVMLMQLKEYRTTFVVSLDSEEVEEFAMMVAMGTFFVPINQRYQMALPSRLTAAKVKAAILKYAQTESEDSGTASRIPGQHNVVRGGQRWQVRLRAIDEFFSNTDHSRLPARLVWPAPQI